jgi:single-strand DNA-binding protein
MLNTIVTFEGNLAADPEVHHTPNGTPIAEFTVLVNRSRQNENGEWVDDEPTRHACKAFRGLGENITETLRRGDRAVVVGHVVTDTWADKATGDKRTRQVVLVDAIGASLRWATATVHKTQRETQKAQA